MNTNPYRVLGHLPQAAVLALIALGAAGCPNVASLTTARVIQPGRHEITIAPSAYGMSAGLFDAKATDLVSTGTIDFGYRVGLDTAVDLGVRVSNFGNMNLDVKVGLLDKEHIRISLDPTLGAVFLSGGDVGVGYVQADLPVLVDFALNEHVSFTVGPRYSLLFFYGGEPGASASKAVHLAGGTVGLELALGSSFAIQPNAGLMFWANAPSALSTMFFNVGVAFKFLLGGPRFADAAQP